MAKRLGETLVEQGAIDRRQLVRALKNQLICGGHLGTSLIELGFIDEETLGRTLAECLHLRYAPAQLFDNIAPEVIGALTPQMAERHKVVPLHRDGDRLHIAVVSSRNLDTLSTSSGFALVPWIAPEFRIMEALERYYRIPRRPRFVSLSGALEPSHTRSVAPGVAPAMSPMDEEALHTARGMPASASDPSPIGVHAVTLSIAASAPAAGNAVAYAEEAPSAAEPAYDPDWNLHELSYLISHADSREEVISVVLAFAANRLSACALFGVRDDIAYPWGARGLELPPDARFRLTSGSVFELLLGHDSYCGPVPDTPLCRRFYEAMQREPPRELLLVPAHLNDRLIAVLYGETEPGRPPDAERLFQGITRKLALGLSMILIKRRIEGP